MLVGAGVGLMMLLALLFNSLSPRRRGVFSHCYRWGTHHIIGFLLLNG